MLLWVVVGPLAVCLLGVACSWVLQGHSRLEPLHPTDPELTERKT